MVNSMLFISALPTFYWGETLMMANWILNWVPYSKSNTTLHQYWLGYPTSLDNFKVWGCLAYVQMQHIRRPKLGPKANRCVFFGFAKDSDAYRFLNLGTNSIIEAWDADFFEDKSIKDKGLSLKNILKCWKVYCTRWINLSRSKNYRCWRRNSRSYRATF